MSEKLWHVICDNDISTYEYMDYNHEMQIWIFLVILVFSNTKYTLIHT